ncbi:MAG: hypothetical protein V1674_03175 [Candidatus Omnitrophota bacterium]
MEYRIDKQGLLDRISAWDSFLKKRVHLIVCSGTALTFLGVKASTKDIDLIVPQIKEYDYLVETLKQLGYKSASGWGWSRSDGFIFDLFRGERVHTTELLESPLREGNHILIKEFSHIYLGILNDYDIIITKIFRSDSIDLEDCLALMKHRAKYIDINLLIKRFKETASSNVSEDKINKNLGYFLNLLKKEGLYNAK